ncbi:MAG: type IX secretion system membrane protein PorP/SprF [Bacteroidales bacterium]|nr:type IX secretion system membrane protein PorP/SprF [Bacteroidales bacterium]
MRRLANIILILFIGIKGYGQFNPTDNMYLLNPLLLNPAYAGSRGALNVMSIYGQKWVGIEGAPHELTFSIDAPLSDKRLGLGLVISNDQLGVVNENQLVSNYAYKIAAGKSTLSFGLGAGVIMTNTNFSKLVVIDPGDERYLTDSKVFAVPNFSFGMFFENPVFFAGLSIPRLLSFEYDYAGNKYSLDNNFNNYSYHLNAGLNLGPGSDISFHPSIMLRYSMIPENAKFQYHLNAGFGFYDRLWLGASYQNQGTVSGMLKFNINKQLGIAYVYDLQVSKLGNYSKGSHFLMLSYIFKYELDAVNPLIF